MSKRYTALENITVTQPGTNTLTFDGAFTYNPDAKIFYAFVGGGGKRKIPFII
jgi:hypothetical protein